MLGYIPDRAYYFTVQRTVERRRCSPGRRSTSARPRTRRCPCPAPAGATLPWHPAPARSPSRRRAPTARPAVIGQTYLYAGGSDGAARRRRHLRLARRSGTGNLDTWTAGPALPEARADAASVVVGNTLYVIGGYGPDGAAHHHRVQPDRRQRRRRSASGCPRRRSRCPSRAPAASAVTVSDGLVLLGGTDGTAADAQRLEEPGPTAPVPCRRGSPQPPLFEENVDGVAAHVGDVIFVVGGRNEDGAVGRHGPAGPRRRRERHARGSRTPITALWRASEQTNLPGPADEHVRVHRERRALRPGRHRRHAARAAETLWAHPGRRRRHRRRGTTWPRSTWARASRARPRVVVGLARLPVRRDDRRGPHRRRRPHQPRAPGAVLPAGRPRGDAPGAPAAGRDRPADRLPQRRHRGRDQLHHPDPDRLRCSTTRRRSGRSSPGAGAGRADRAALSRRSSAAGSPAAVAVPVAAGRRLSRGAGPRRAPPGRA